MKILDLGCGNNKMQGAIGVDIDLDSQADVICSLNVFPYPFTDNSFDLIICNHVLEHLEDIIKVMEEIYRIGKPNAVVKIVTPHFSSIDSWTDITHKHHFALGSFDAFSDSARTYHLTSKARFEIIEKRLEFKNHFKRWGIHLLANKFPRKYELYYTYCFPAKKMHIKLKVVKD